MKALHIYSSAPFFKYHKDEEFYIDDFDILSAILSALTWQKYNGPIKLYADSTVLKYYRELGIEDLWNGKRPERRTYIEFYRPIWSSVHDFLQRIINRSCRVQHSSPAGIHRDVHQRLIPL